MILLERSDQRRDRRLRILVGHLKNRGVREGCLNGLHIQAWAKNPERGCLFVLAVKDGTIERSLKACHVIGNLLRVLLPQGLG